MKVNKTYQIKGGQLFVRKPTETTDMEGKYAYLVCGMIITDKPLEDEAVHTISVDAFTYGQSIVSEYQVETAEDLGSEFKGNNFDGIMRQPIWRLKL